MERRKSRGETAKEIELYDTTGTTIVVVGRARAVHSSKAVRGDTAVWWYGYYYSSSTTVVLQLDHNTDHERGL